MHASSTPSRSSRTAPTATWRRISSSGTRWSSVARSSASRSWPGLAGQRGEDGQDRPHRVRPRRVPDAPLELTVDRMHAGRAVASSSVTVSQGDTLCARSVVLLTATEPDVIRHADTPPRASKPDDVADHVRQSGAFEVGVVGDVDINDPDQVGPAELDVWVRFAGAPGRARRSTRHSLAFANEGFLIGTAMRPHAGHRAEPGAPDALDRGAEPHAHLPRGVPGRGVAPAATAQPLRGPRPQLRSGRRLPRRRSAGGLVRAGRHDQGPRRRAGQALRAAGDPHGERHR